MEIASAFVSLLPSAKGFGSKLSTQVGREVEGSGKKLGSAFGKTFALAGGALAAAGVTSFFKDAVGQASDLNESSTKIEAIFGRASGAVQKFAAQGATALGQTKLEVLDASATFGTFGKAAGLGGKDLAKFSTGFASLSTDLASFYNTSPEQAVEAIGAALRGEAEPIRQYGVLLDDATLRNEALKLGLIETTKQALTPQQKVLAAQAAIYKQTKDAQGDFQRTSGGLANQQRILAAQWSDMKTRLGTALLPAVLKVVTALNAGLGPAIDWTTKAFAQAQTFLAPFVAQVKDFFGGSGGAQIQSFGTQIMAVFQGQVLPVLRQAAITFQTVVLPAVTRLVTYVATSLWPAFMQFVNIVRNNVLPIVLSFATFLYGTLYPAVVRIASVVAGNLKPVFDQLVATFRARVLPALQQILVRFREWQPTIQKVISVVVLIIGKVLQFASAVLGKVLPVVIRFAGFLLSKLVPAILNTIEFIARLIGFAIKVGAAFVKAIVGIVKFQLAIYRKVGEAIAFVAGIPGKVMSALGDLGSMLLHSGEALIQGFIDGINNKVGDVTGAAGNLVSKVRDFFPFSPAKKGPFSGRGWVLYSGHSLSEALAKGIKDKAPKAVKAAFNLVSRVKEQIDRLMDSVRQMSSSIAGTFTSGLFDVTQEVAATGGGWGKSMASAASSLSQQFLSNLLSKRAELTRLLSAFKKLVGWGLSPQFLSNLFQSGNGALILDLAGSKAQARQASAIYGQVNTLATRLGSSVATEVYGPQIVRRLDDLTKAVNRLPHGLGREINGAASKGRNKSR